MFYDQLDKTTVFSPTEERRLRIVVLLYSNYVLVSVFEIIILNKPYVV